MAHFRRLFHFAFLSQGLLRNCVWIWVSCLGESQYELTHHLRHALLVKLATELRKSILQSLARLFVRVFWDLLWAGSGVTQAYTQHMPCLGDSPHSSTSKSYREPKRKVPPSYGPHANPKIESVFPATLEGRIVVLPQLLRPTRTLDR